MMPSYGPEVLMHKLFNKPSQTMQSNRLGKPSIKSRVSPVVAVPLPPPPATIVLVQLFFSCYV